MLYGIQNGQTNYVTLCFSLLAFLSLRAGERVKRRFSSVKSGKLMMKIALQQPTTNPFVRHTIYAEEWPQRRRRMTETMVLAHKVQRERTTRM